MTASLHHARPILAAALEAGLRESGVQSLKSLDDSNAFPMVAVRTAGLSLSSVVGLVYNDGTGGDDKVCPIVDERYFQLLLALANDRFGSNIQRIDRFQENIFRSKHNRKCSRRDQWEDRVARAERQRAEGLQEQARHREKRQIEHTGDT